MTTIYHLVVGDADFIPTDEQLKEIIEEFQKPLPAFGVPVAIYVISIMPNQERLVLNVGDPDWHPKQDELDQLVIRFQEAVLAPNDSIVATRSGVTAAVIPKLVT